MNKRKRKRKKQNLYSLLDILSDLVDPRNAKGKRYELVSILRLSL